MPLPSPLSAADLAGLRPYLVNLTAGRLSTTGEAKTTVEDVDSTGACARWSTRAVPTA